jgi:cytochrome c556
MRHRTRITTLFATLALAACGGAPADPPEQESAPGDTAVEPPAETAVTRAALPGLFDIMMGLEGEMARVGHGVWLADFEIIAAAADGIAAHPAIPADELKLLRAGLGDDMIGFRDLDTRVHDLALELKAAAEEADMEAVLSSDAALRTACVTCHDTFRERIRDGVRATTDSASQ